MEFSTYKDILLVIAALYFMYRIYKFVNNEIKSNKKVPYEPRSIFQTDFKLKEITEQTLDEQLSSLINMLHRPISEKIKFNVWVTSVHELNEINDTNIRNISRTTILYADMALVDWSPTHYLMYKGHWVNNNSLVRKEVINTILNGIEKSETHVLNYMEPIINKMPKSEQVDYHGVLNLFGGTDGK